MPRRRLNGFERGRRLRAALGGALVLVACTAYSDDPTRRLAEVGFDARFVKPAEVADLVRWVECWPFTPCAAPADPPGPAGPPA